MPLFVVGRVFAGFGVGLVSCLIPMYQSEWYVSSSRIPPNLLISSSSVPQSGSVVPVSPRSFSLVVAANRRVFTVVSCYQWAITIGLLLAAIVNNATQNRGNHSAYRIPIAIQFVWAAVLSSGMTFLPEVRISSVLLPAPPVPDRVFIVSSIPYQAWPR